MYEKMIQIDPKAPTEAENRAKAVTKPRWVRGRRWGRKEGRKGMIRGISVWEEGKEVCVWNRKGKGRWVP